MGRCQCAVQCGVYEPGAGHHFKGKCPRDAVRLVTVTIHVARPDLCADSKNVTVERALCSECSKHHDESGAK